MGLKGFQLCLGRDQDYCYLFSSQTLADVIILVSVQELMCTLPWIIEKENRALSTSSIV